MAVFDYLEQYATFQSVEDMDKSVEDHMAEHYFNLTESERAIVFMLASRSLAYPGACHLKADTIATKLNISAKTVYRAVKKLNELGIIKKVTTIRDKKGGQGANVYVILPYVPAQMSERENADTSDCNNVCEPSTENQPSSSFNLLKTSNLYDVYNDAHAEKEACKKYMNEYQVMLFDFMNSLPLADNLKDELHKVILASQVNSVDEFIKAKNVLFKIAMDIKEGILTVTSTLRAVFAGAYSRAVERLNNKVSKPSSVEDRAHTGRPVPFYNWLEERESRTEICNRPNLENWLEW